MDEITLSTFGHLAGYLQPCTALNHQALSMPVESLKPVATHIQGVCVPTNIESIVRLYSILAQFTPEQYVTYRSLLRESSTWDTRESVAYCVWMDDAAKQAIAVAEKSEERHKNLKAWSDLWRCSLISVSFALVFCVALGPWVAIAFLAAPGWLYGTQGYALYQSAKSRRTATNG